MSRQYNIIRQNSSDYFTPDFIQQEKKELTSPETSYGQNKGEHNILITNTKSVISDLNKVDLIIQPNSGFDNISCNLAKSNTPIVLGNPIRAEAVCNYILTVLFKHFNPIPNYKTFKNRKFKRELLSSKKILLVGYGHIGKLLYNALKGLSDIRIHDPYQGYNSSLKNFQVIILACGLNRKNVNFVDKKFLDGQAPDLLLINTARGELVKEHDLICFLSKNKDAYAYLDVFHKEPNDFRTFKNISNINLTPHIAGVYPEISKQTIVFEKEIIHSFIHDINFHKKYAHLILNNFANDLFLI
jgi:D-3-phosphoglycerate dehydrogenase